MKKTVGVSLLSFAFLLLLSARLSSAESWRDLLNQADSLFDAGKYNSAIVVGQKALEKVEKEFGGEDTAVALVLHRLGVYHSYKANYDSAESLYKRALAIREKALGPSHVDVAKTLHNLANLYGDQGKYTEAEPLGKRSLTIFENALGPEDPYYVAVSLNNLANLYGDQGKYAEAEPLYKRALAIWEKALGPEHVYVASSLNSLAILYQNQGKFAEVEHPLRRALAIWEKALGPDHPDVAVSLNNLATLYMAQGRYAEVEHLLRRALVIWEKALGPDHPNVAVSLTNLANLYFEQGKYAQAQSLYQRALTVREKALGPDHPDVVYSLNNLAFVYLPQGRYAEAERLYKRALAISEKTRGPDYPLVALSLSNLAVLYFDQGRYAEAEPLGKRALSIIEKALGPEHLHVARTLGGLAICCMVQGKCAEAEPLYKQALDILEKDLGRDHPDVAWILESFSYNFRLRGDAKRSLEMAKRAFEIRKRNFRDVSSVMSEKDALTYSLFMRTSASNYLSVFLDSRLDEDTLVRSAVDVIVSSKGQVSDEIFARNKSIISEPDTNLFPLVDSLCYTRFRISKLYVEGPDEDSPKSYFPLLDSLSKEKERLESELARRSASFRQKQELWEVDAQKILAALPDKSVLVEYLQYNYHQFQPDSLLPRGYLPRYLVVTAFPPDNVFISDLGEVSQIDPLIDQYRKHLLSVSSSGRLPTPVDQTDYEKINKPLYDRVWKPVEGQISDKDLVFIAPDGGLNLVSFAGLMGEDGKYLIEKYPIHYLSSGRDLIRLKDEAKPASGMFALGDPDYNAAALARLSIPEGTPQDSLPEPDYYATRNVRSGCGELKDMTISPLPWTKSEVEKIAESFHKSSNESVVAYYGADASEEHLKSKAPGNRVIHLATHGYFIQGKCQVEVSRRGFGLEDSYVGENPLLLSGLFLAGANLHGEGADSLGAEDGILTAEEVTAMNLNGTELVVLSACETGLGEVKSGEGVYGLRRAFQMAGARTVISALWPVSDKATAEMMSKLYQTKIESLPRRIRKLQLETINQLRNQNQPDHPFSWGAFIALGNWR